MIAFAAPAALIALAALAVPIALHLWSRLTGRPLRVGTVAWFAAAPPPVSRRPRIDDFWLLVLRCGIVAALVFAMAEPYWRSSVPGRSDAVWALVAADVADDAAAQPLIDSLRSSGADVKVLAPGPIWSLLREADYEAPEGTRFVVVASNTGASGARPQLRAETEWLVPRPGPHPLPPSPETGEGRLNRKSRTVVIYSDGSHREDAKYLTAALRAAAEATGQPAIITQRDVATLGSEADWIIWLADGDVPDSLLAQTRRGATLLTYTTADSSSPRHITFSTRFHPSSSDFVLQPAFPESIAALWTGPTPEPLRPVSHSQLLPARATGISPASPKGRDLYHAFWLAAVVLFLLERALARRARAVAA